MTNRFAVEFNSDGQVTCDNPQVFHTMSGKDEPLEIHEELYMYG